MQFVFKKLKNKNLHKSNHDYDQIVFKPVWPNQGSTETGLQQKQVLVFVI